MLKNKIESICRRGNMRPIKRDMVDGVDVFIADGFAAMPHVTYKKFGIEDGDFPFGCYATLWWISSDGEKLDTGQPLFFDAFHDKQLGVGSKQLARVNTALKTATEFLRQYKMVKAHGVPN